ncbi:MAG: glutathione-disulfide reductase, partial [Anaerolineales bacterium]|nr:glutathione-disulfide reductase [Anaerolineales bacterium]
PPASFDWHTLLHNKDKEIARLNGIYDGLLTGAGVDVFHGRAKLIDPHTVEVGGQTYTAANILIATGGWPRLLNIPGIEHVITSNDVFFLDELPQRLLIVGGGYIGIEFAGIFNNLGTKITQVYIEDLFLMGFDDDIRHALHEEMSAKGVDIRGNTTVEKIELVNGREKQVHLSDGSVLVVDEVLFAIGRVPQTNGLGLEENGIELDRIGAICVNEQYQTSQPHIYAIGDVTNRKNLTPVATAEGMIIARRLFNDQDTNISYDNIPTAIFSQPPIGTVGLSEAEARAQYTNVTVYRTRFRPMKNTLSGRAERTLMKLIVNADTDQVVGVHMLGPDAGEIIQGFAVALKAGATKAVFDSTIGIHPTAAEEFVTMRTPVES